MHHNPFINRNVIWVMFTNLLSERWNCHQRFTLELKEWNIDKLDPLHPNKFETLICIRIYIYMYKLSTCKHIYIYICMYTHAQLVYTMCIMKPWYIHYITTYIYINIYIYTYTIAYTYIISVHYIHTHTHIYIYIHNCIHIYYICIYYIYICYIYIQYMYINTYVYIHIFA